MFRLISILLSRFRLTVDDCLKEYEHLGKEIFGYPQSFSIKGLVRPRLNPKRLHEVIQNVTSRRSLGSSRYRYAMDKVNQDMSLWYVKRPCVIDCN